MTSLRGVNRARDQSSVSLASEVAGKDFQNSGQTKQKMFSFSRRLQ